MPLRKFRTIEEMNAADAELWCAAPDAAYYRRIRQLWNTSSKLNPRKYPRGVFKFRTLEEAQQQRDNQLAEHVRRTQSSADWKVVKTPGG